MCLLNIDSSTNNCFSLHLCNFRICNCKTKTTVAHHWVKLVERSNNILNLLNCFALCFGKKLNVLFLCRNELMERRIQETDCNRVTVHGLIELLKVALLHWLKLCKCGLSLLYCIGANHLTNSSNSLGIKEHMLCTAKADALCDLVGSLRRYPCRGA